MLRIWLMRVHCGSWFAFQGTAPVKTSGHWLIGLWLPAPHSKQNWEDCALNTKASTTDFLSAIYIEWDYHAWPCEKLAGEFAGGYSALLRRSWQEKRKYFQTCWTVVFVDYYWANWIQNSCDAHDYRINHEQVSSVLCYEKIVSVRIKRPLSII